MNRIRKNRATALVARIYSPLLLTLGLTVGCGVQDPAFTTVATGAQASAEPGDGASGPDVGAPQREGDARGRSSGAVGDSPSQSPVTEATGTRVSAPGQVVFEQGAILVRPGETRNLSELLKNPDGDQVAYAIEKPAHLLEVDFGRVDANGVYKAPARVLEEQSTFKVRARTAVGEALIDMRLVPSESFVVEDDQTTQGLTGNVFDFHGVQHQKLPNFDTMTPVASVLMPDVHVPLRSFSAGFPGVRDLFEWFGVRFTGRLAIPASGQYTFILQSDDGAKLSIDGAKVVDNDGVHSSARKSGTVTLKEGLRDLRLDYFQGPRYHIELQLFWKTPGSNVEELVPASALRRPVRR